MRCLPGFAAVAVLLLAGCSQAPASPEGEFAQQASLAATEQTGILWGVVVDATIKPLPGVQVNVTDGPTGRTDDEGRFGFDDLAPGFYSVSFQATGFHELVLQMSVEAGNVPPMQRVQLEALPVLTPYVETVHFAGFLACSVTVTLDFSACSFPTFIYDMVGTRPYDDKQIFFQVVNAPPSWVQMEMTWDSTQALGSEMSIGLDTTAKDGSGWWGVNGTRGPSPLMTSADTARSTEAGYGVTHDVMMRIFGSDLPETRLPDPCIPQPILGYCFLGVGVTAQQATDIYLTLFYNRLPEPGWTLVADGPA